MRKLSTLFIFLLLAGTLTIHAQPVLYGLTSQGGGGGGGTLIKFNPVSNQLSTVYGWDRSGQAPFKNDLVEFGGNFFGMTTQGGRSGGGTIFSFDPSTNTHTKQFDFTDANGRFPYGSLVVNNGKLYGMTTSGGTNNFGTIFSFDPAVNSYVKLYDFNNLTGINPWGNLLLFNGKFYGMTYGGGSGGYGTIFSFDPTNNTYAKLHDFDFTNGTSPRGSLIEYNGRLYGMTDGGSNFAGTIFSFDLTNNTLSKLHDFDAINGAYPYGSLVVSGNTFYGMTSGSGSGGNGTVFSFDPSSNTLTTLLDFNLSNGSNPYGSLVTFGGKLFGVTSLGGNGDAGTIFSIDMTSKTHSVLHSFNINNGAYPYGSLMIFGNKLFGMTNGGGSSGRGTIFSYDPGTSAHAMLYDFNNLSGSDPFGSLVISGTKLYGMTNSGGSNGEGTIFSFEPSINTHTKIHDFSRANGANPFGNLVATGNKLYGMTTYGGSNDFGSIFSFDPVTNTHVKLHDFDIIFNGGFPHGSLVEFGGTLYGTTRDGGTYNYGTIFSFETASNTFTKLYDFSQIDGANPHCTLVESAGKLYGVTFGGGNNGTGNIFSFDPVGNIFASLYDFSNSVGNPLGSLVALDGKLYGMTTNGGSNFLGAIFSFDPSGNLFTKLHDFSSNDGGNPFGSLTESSGKLYGMTNAGGSNGLGTVFSFDPANNTFSKLQDFSFTNGANPYYNAAFIEVNSCIPSAEICDGVDNDCDGLIDEGCDFKFFRSRESGNWANTATWEYSVDSLAWLPATRVPLQTDSTILIRSGDSVTFSSFNVTVDALVIDAGGTMIIADGSYLNINVPNNTRPSIEVNGKLVTRGNASIVGSSSGRMVLINGVCTMEGAGFLMSGSSWVYVSPTGTLNLVSSNGQQVQSLVNAGTVNWLNGDFSYGRSAHPVNYGIWNDSSSGIMNGFGGPQFKNWGTYRKIVGNSMFDGPNPLIVNRGIITGNGRINLGKGDSSLNLGIIHPGDSIGKLTLAFNQPNTLTELNIQLGNLTGPGTGHDLLELEGNLALGGTLNVSELGPLANASFTIIRKLSGSLTGTFNSINLPPNYTIEYYIDSVVLVKAPPVVSRNISISNPAAVTEGNSGLKELKFVVRLNAASTGIVRVNYATFDSTATAGEDYATTTGTLTVPAGQLTDTIRVLINGDRLVEGAERLKVMLSSPVNGIITTGQAIGTINNDDVLPAITISSYTITEGTGTDSLLQVQVRLANAYPLSVTVNFTTADSTATNGTDYTGAPGTLTFAPGDTLEFIPVLIKGDGIDEANEIINVNLSNAVNASLAATTRGRITINDDDLIPGIVVSNISVTEKDLVDTVILVPVRLNRRYVETVTINYSSADSTATNGIDYDGVNGTLTFVPGDTLELIPIKIRGDRIDEPNEIIKLSYFGVVNATPASASTRLTITDNDVLPAVQFTNLSVPEGNSGGTATVTLQVRLSSAYPLPVTIAYATSDSTATAGDDYTTVSGVLTFAPEETVQTISLPVNGDYLAEGTEIIKLRFSNAINATVSTTPSRISLTNDDVYPTITASATSVTEGNTGTVNQFVTVRLSKRYPLPVTVQLSTSDLTAVADQDYTSTSTTLTFPALGDTLQTVLVPIIGDLLDEANETYRITLGNPQYGKLGGGGITTATINDNDPVPAIRVIDSIAAEADGQISFKVRLNNPSGRLVTVNWATQNGTALAGFDYTAVTAATVNFLPGEAEKLIVVPLLSDAEAETSETFTIVLSGAVYGTLTASQGGDATAIATIQNSVSTSVNRRTNGSSLLDGNILELQVKVLPNPSRNYFTLNLTGSGQEEIHIRVSDLQGRLLESRKLDQGTHQVKLGDRWINGTYILEVIQGTERKTMQLVKLR